MKKLTVILFSFFYLFASAGITVNMHYCAGQVQYVEFLAANGKCCCADEGDTVSCCGDETFFFQLDNEQQTSQKVRVVPEQFVSGIAAVLNTTDRFEPVSKAIDFERLDLPPPQRQPIWLLNCSLVYYG